MQLQKVLNISAERYYRTAGQLFIYEGDYEAALDLVEKTLSLEPENVRALVLKGDILFCLQADEESLAVLDQALLLSPTCVEAYLSKASIYELIGQYREALQCCNQALAYADHNQTSLLTTLIDQKITVLIQLRKYREALRLLQNAATCLPRDSYDYLRMSYKSLLEQYCRLRQANRSKAKTSSLQILR